jgi:hypothetical protein
MTMNAPAPKKNPTQRDAELEEFARVFNENPGPATQAAAAGVSAEAAARAAGMDPAAQDEQDGESDNATDKQAGAQTSKTQK